MGWERRKNNWYYFRTRRIEGRVVRTYFGRGPQAEAAAAEDALLREKQREERRQDALMLEQWSRIREKLDRYYAQVQVLIRAHMVIKGFHYHRGQWRKRRGFDRRQAEYEAACREEQEALERKAAAESHRPARRSMPVAPPRDPGPGLVRSPSTSMDQQDQTNGDRSQRKHRSLWRRSQIPLLALRASLREVRKRASADECDPSQQHRATKQGSAARPPPMN